MGETKKRRQTKHRGNAAGMVETRGRTGVRGAQSTGSGGRAGRVPPEPSWQRAAMKALVPVLILTPFMFFMQKGTPATGKLIFIGFAFLMYVPMSYYIDRWAHQRYLKQQGR